MIPKNLPSNFPSFNDFTNVTELQNQLQKLIETTDLRFFVIKEGNRRIATAKLLSNLELRQKLKIKSQYFPVSKNDTVAKDILWIPSIVYERRETISPYLGVRHIIGRSKWESFPTALYIHKQIENLKSTGFKTAEAISVVQKKTGDRSDKIRKQLLYYKVYKEAESGIDVDIKSVKNRFSLLEACMRISCNKRIYWC